MVLVAWGRFAAKQDSVAVIEEVLWSWGQHGPRLRKLLEVKRSALLRAGEDSAEALETRGEFDDPELEFLRLGTMGVVYRSNSEQLEANTVRLREFAENHPEFSWFSSVIRSREAHESYWNGDYAGSAKLQLQAASFATQKIWRYRAIVNAVWALIDDFDFEVAAELAQKHLEGVIEFGDPHLELQFHTARRQALYRGGADLEPTDEILAAALQVGYEPLINVLVLQEASLRWRKGARVDAANVARITARKWSSKSQNWPMLPIVVLHAFLTGDTLTETVLDAVDACPFPRLKAQMLGLASYLVNDGADAMRDRARQLVEPSHHSVRLEVIAIDEIDHLERLGQLE
jgi:hypothetical protein